MTAPANSDPETPAIACAVGDEDAGRRLDAYLAGREPDHSRSAVQAWIRAGRVTVDGRPASPSTRLAAGAEVRYRPAPPTRAERWTPEPIPLNIVHEDADIVVVDKPAGLVVHPGAGNATGTLVAGTLYRYPETERVPRAGIVHRLDKDTTGLMVVARSERAHLALSRDIAARRVTRAYFAVANHPMVAGQTIDAPIARHPVDRLKMAVVAADDPRGRPARTHLRVATHFRRHTALDCALETGRTHQIRVHLAHLGHPLVGDRTYGGRPLLPPDPHPDLARRLPEFPRQALHARRLVLSHPGTGTEAAFESPLPADLEALVAALAVDRDTHGG